MMSIHMETQSLHLQDQCSLCFFIC